MRIMMTGAISCASEPCFGLLHRQSRRTNVRFFGQPPQWRWQGYGRLSTTQPQQVDKQFFNFRFS